MPTTRGWAALGAGAALLILWWIYGEPELLLSGTFLILGVLAAVAYVQVHSNDVTASRRLAAAAVHNGDTNTVSLVLANQGTRRAPNLTVVDEVESLGMASFELASLGAGDTGTASYRVNCRPRGVYRVGPALITIADPLGLAELPATAGPEDLLIVYPTVEDLSGFPIVRGLDPALSAARPEHSQRGGEDFYTLREYQRGDDLRRVHWPYSARTDELMIRQLETPWQSRALVLLDVRPQVYESADAFEKAVSGAASIVTHLARLGFDADLWAGDANPIDASRYGATLEKLALVEPIDGLDLTVVAGRLRQHGGGGALVLVTGTADRTLLGVQRLLAGDYPSTVLMGATSSISQSITGFHRLGVVTVTTAPDGSWQEAWITALGAQWAGVSAS